MSQTIPEPASSKPLQHVTRARSVRPALLTLPPEGDGLIREEQACAALQIGRSTLWRWTRDGRLTAVRIGRATRWRISDLRALLVGDATNPLEPRRRAENRNRPRSSK